MRLQKFDVIGKNLNIVKREMKYNNKEVIVDFLLYSSSPSFDAEISMTEKEFKEFKDEVNKY